MNYLALIGEAVRAALPPEHQDGDPGIFVVYALLARTKGLETTAADVHDAWVVWKTLQESPHEATVPFDELSLEVQDKDLPFLRAIHQVARDT